MGVIKKAFKVLAGLFFVILLVYPAYAASIDIQPEFKGHEKMGLTLKSIWEKAMSEGDLTREVSCTVKTKGSINEKLVADLKEAGLKVGTVLKTIVTGKIEVGNLPFLVAIDDVVAVEGGRKVRFKGRMLPK